MINFKITNKRCLYSIVLIFAIHYSFLAQNKGYSDFSDKFYKSIYSGAWEKSDSLLLNFKTNIKDSTDFAKHQWFLGYLNLQKSNYLDAYKSFLTARTFYKENNLLKEQAKSESRLIECIYLIDNRNLNSDIIELMDIDELINSTCEISKILKDDDIRIHCEYNSSIRAENLNKFEKSLFHLNTMGQIYLKQKDSVRYIANLLNVAPTLHHLKRYKDAISQLNIAQHYYDFKDVKNYRSRILVYSHKCDQYYYLNKLDSALLNINKAKNLLKQYDNLDYKIFVYEQVVDLHEKRNDFKEAFLASKKLEKFRDSIQYKNLVKDIGDIKTKYESQEKDTENTILKAKQQKSTYQIYGLIALLLLTAIVTYSIYINSKKKRQIIIQNRELDKEKNNKILRDLELKAIDAMIAGQKVERKRISEDLHDNLGSTLTTLKFYFETLKGQLIGDNSKIFNKTELLLSEAYSKIREMAHIRNRLTVSGQGLILAIEDLALKISETKKIQVEIAHHVDGKSLDNNLELELFRIIQELITNIIKHAEAKHITINITSFENSINILVEDDGIGFNTEEIKSKKGIGLSSIEERVNNLEGKINFESVINKGSSICLDIPI